ncbi:hypothetical protein [Chromohalobacter moromii]
MLQLTAQAMDHDQRRPLTDIDVMQAPTGCVDEAAARR